VTPEIILAAISAGIAAFAGLGRSLNNFNDKLDKRFVKIETDLDSLEQDLVRDYVLKQDFLREMQAVHQKLDRIWEYMIHTNNN
jgi:ABC-type phosphate transport system auxiliary subunit